MSADTDESDPRSLVAELNRLHDAGHLTDDEFATASRAVIDPSDPQPLPADPTTEGPGRPAPDTGPAHTGRPQRGALPIVASALLAVAVVVSAAFISTSTPGTPSTVSAAPLTTTTPETASPTSTPSEAATTPTSTASEPSALPTTDTGPVATSAVEPARTAAPQQDPTTTTTPPMTGTPAPTTRTSTTTVRADSGWQSTGAQAVSGDSVKIVVVSGQWTSWKGHTPLNSGQGDPSYVCANSIPASQCAEPVPTAAGGALVGQIGSQRFAVGTGTTVTGSDSGDIQLRINDGDGTSLDDNTGTLTVRITITSP